MEGSNTKKRLTFGHHRKDNLTRQTTIDGGELITQPRKLNGSTAETPSHQDLHRELLLSHKRGLHLEEKPELKRVLEQRRLEQHRLEQPPSDLEMELRKRQQKMKEYEQEEIRRREDQEKIPEFIRVKDNLRRTSAP